MQTLQTFVQTDMLPKKTDLKYPPPPPPPPYKKIKTPRSKQTNRTATHV